MRNGRARQPQVLQVPLLRQVPNCRLLNMVFNILRTIWVPQITVLWDSMAWDKTKNIDSQRCTGEPFSRIRQPHMDSRNPKFLKECTILIHIFRHSRYAKTLLNVFEARCAACRYAIKLTMLLSKVIICRDSSLHWQVNEYTGKSILTAPCSSFFVASIMMDFEPITTIRFLIGIRQSGLQNA